MAQTRRLAAILAGDVVGYSHLMGEYEVGTAKPKGANTKPISKELPGRVVSGRLRYVCVLLQIV